MEYHLFIIWEKAQWKKQDIIYDIKKELEIIKEIDITWDKSRFSENLSRFYGQNLPNCSKKEKECGNGTFTLIFVKDHHPNYAERKTSRGYEVVNANIFDRKEKYRSWTNDETTPKNYHGSRIHGTNNEKETRHNLVTLIGLSPEDLEKQANYFPNKLKSNVVGLDGWDSLSQLFYCLNNSVNYLVLRNFEYLPEKFKSSEHGDIDLLTDDFKRLKWILGGKKVFKSKFRVHYCVKINGDDVYFDLRYVGDNYYDLNWENEMIKNRILCKRGFYILKDEDYRYSLLYHALVHKSFISSEYKEKLSNLFAMPINDYVNEIRNFLKKHNYVFTIPNDLSVFINTENSGLPIKLTRKLYYLILKIDKHLFKGKLKF